MDCRFFCGFVCGQPLDNLVCQESDVSYISNVFFLFDFISCFVDILEKINATPTAVMSHIACLRNVVKEAVEKIIMSPIDDRIVTAMIMSRLIFFISNL